MLNVNRLLALLNANINVVLLVLAITCLSIAGFLYSTIIGFVVLGVLLFISAFLITPFTPQERS